MMFKYIGAAVGRCAGIAGCGRAPDLIYDSFPHLKNNWQTTVRYKKEETDSHNSVDLLKIFSEQLASEVKNIVQSGDQFITFGGDHSCAIGTWSGVAECYDEFGLLWIDAHMDAHTEETSPTGNYHGMPVAILLGHGNSELVNICSKPAKVKPENIQMIGVRSYEPHEKALLDSLGVKYYEMPEVKQRGFDACFDQVLNDFSKKGLKFGISIDLDGLDTGDIKALGTPVDDGIRLNDLIQALYHCSSQDLIGVEIAEYNPTLDTEDYQDIKVIDRIVQCMTAKNSEF
jgi:arginase